MKIALIAVSILVVLSIALLFILGKYSQRGQAAGLVDGSLSRCPEKPNCVCSEYMSEHHMDIVYSSVIQNGEGELKAKVVSTIEEMHGKVQNTRHNYIAATFKSSIFGFVDDLEIRIVPGEGIMHIRSASRVGYGDGGINRQRVELFKQLYRRNIE